MRPFRTQRYRGMTFLAKGRRRLQQMNPYLSLLVLLVPLMFVEPLKVAALFIAGKGHWIAGSGVLLGAYIVSLFFIERLFRVLKQKCLMLPWFAKPWFWFVTVRQKAFALVKSR